MLNIFSVFLNQRFRFFIKKESQYKLQEMVVSGFKEKVSEMGASNFLGGRNGERLLGGGTRHLRSGLVARDRAILESIFAEG
jgi:hypothetical protein